MRSDDLAPFAVADGLLARIEQRPSGATDQERQYMLDHAREELAKALGITLDDAGRTLHNAALAGTLIEQYSDQFAVVTLERRILYVLARSALRGACHPESN